MKLVLRCLALFFLVLTGGCTSTTVLRSAPKDGIPVEGINVLFLILPPGDMKVSDTRKPALNMPSNEDMAVSMRLQTDRLRDEVKERLIPQLNSKGFATNFESINVLPGIAPPPLRTLFPADSLSRHTLVIAPVQEKMTCSPCRSSIVVSVILRAPVTNMELWSVMLTQSTQSGANWIQTRNYQFIDDMANSVLAVAVRK